MIWILYIASLILTFWLDSVPFPSLTTLSLRPLASSSNFTTCTQTVTSGFLFCKLGVSFTLLMTFMSVLLEYKLKHLFQKVLKGNIFSVSLNWTGFYFALGNNGAFSGYRCYVKVIFPTSSLDCFFTVCSLMRCLAPARVLLFVGFPLGAFRSNTLHHPTCMHIQVCIHIHPGIPFHLSLYSGVPYWNGRPQFHLRLGRFCYYFLDYWSFIDYLLIIASLWSFCDLLSLNIMPFPFLRGAPISSFVLWVLDGPSAFALNPGVELLTHPWKHSYLNLQSLTYVL